jgi:hypothetical protein
VKDGVLDERFTKEQIKKKKKGHGEGFLEKKP